MIVGDGSISVDPAALEALGAQAARVAGSTSGTRGGFAGAASAAAGCEEPAASSFATLQSLIGGALSCLDDCAEALSRAVSNAAAAYVRTDTSQLPGNG